MTGVPRLNIYLDRETKIVGCGLTPEEAYQNMQFYVERRGKLSSKHLARRKEIYAWLPRPGFIHVKSVGAIQYKNDEFINLRTGRRVRAQRKSLAHYLDLFNAFDGYLSFEDFTLTIAQEINQFLEDVSDVYQAIDDFPIVKPVDNLDIKHYHATNIPDLIVIETYSGTIAVTDGDRVLEVDKMIGVSCDCLLAYLFAYMGYLFDGRSLRKLDENRDNL